MCMTSSEYRVAVHQFFGTLLPTEETMKSRSTLSEATRQEMLLRGHQTDQQKSCDEAIFIWCRGQRVARNLTHGEETFASKFGQCPTGGNNLIIASCFQIWSLLCLLQRLSYSVEFVTSTD
ncbi:hypothetical protein Mapa_000095 [Marchantia paleacea]|nr:hypothetical protein Mapa_000095 [Marchantia paleacea]